MRNLYVAAFFADRATQPDETIARLAINITTLLAILCWIFVALFLLSRVIPNLKSKFDDILGERVFFLAWLVPTVAMLFSLIFSEFFGWTPCKLCWYQRIFMYSLSFLMLAYWFIRNKWLRRAGYLLAACGAPISFYHIGLEPKFMWFSESTSCNPDVPCSSPWFTSMGFLTTAGMALTAFITVGVLLYMTSKYGAEENKNNS